MSDTHSISQLFAWLSSELEGLRSASIDAEHMLSECDLRDRADPEYFKRLQNLDLLTQSLENLSLISDRLSKDVAMDSHVTSNQMFDVIKLDAMSERLSQFLGTDADIKIRPGQSKAVSSSDVELFD